MGDLLNAAGGGDVKTDELGFVFGALIVLGLAVVVASLLAGGVRGEEGKEERGEAMLAALVAPTSFFFGDILTARLERGVDGSETAKDGMMLGVGSSASRRYCASPRADRAFRACGARIVSCACVWGSPFIYRRNLPILVSVQPQIDQLVFGVIVMVRVSIGVCVRL